jgi:hypothetical protein
MSLANKPRRGRPTILDAIVGREPDGKAIRVLDAIAKSLTSGNYFETACARAGVTAEQAYEWLRTAAKIRIRATARELEDLDLTHLEHLCLEFQDAVLKAESVWETAALATLERLGSGEIKVTTTKTREVIDAQTGEVRERVVTTTVRELPPSANVLTWRLSRRFPQRYGNNVEPEQHATLSENEHAEALVESIEAYLASDDNIEPPD